MPVPETQLQKFLRLVTYLSPFVPSIFSFTTHLHELLKKGTEFIWNNSFQEAFNKVTSMVCRDTTLQYFNICKAVTVQVDTSEKGLGVTLLQDGNPVAFASKALMLMKQCYVNIECELLTCVFGAEWFYTYVLAMPSLLRVTISLLNRTTSRIWQIHQFIYRECCSDSRPMMSPSSIDLAKRCWLQMPSLTMHPQGSRDTSRHHHQPCAHHTWQETWVPGSHPRWPTPPIPCWDNHHRLARWYQWCPIYSMPIPWPQKHPHSWRWPHSLRWSSHHSSIRKVEDPPSNTWRTHGNQQVPKQSQTLCVLTWNQLRHQMPHWIMPNMPMSPPTGTTTATPANTGPRVPMATLWQWLLPLWWIWIHSCHRLLFQDAHHQKNPCISMHHLQDHLSPEGTLCRTWHRRDTVHWYAMPQVPNHAVNS